MDPNKNSMLEKALRKEGFLFVIMTPVMKTRILATISVIFFFLCLFIYTQSQSLYGGDAGDLVTAAYAGGVAHPPGYPLYTFLGYILSHSIPIGTVAWRVSFLSSVPLALALGVLFFYTALISGSILGSLVAVLTLGLTYLYWLYAIVPEVFGLHILIVSLQLLTLYQWKKTYHKNYGLAFVFMFILSLSHHHIVLFMVPAYIYALLQEQKKIISFLKINRAYIVLALIIGLLPTLWYVFSIPHLAAYTWEDTFSFFNVLKIVTRATYGSFASAVVTVEKPLSRLTDLYAYVVFLAEDFTLPGIALAFVGSIYHLYKNKKEYIFHLLGFLFTGPFYIFYGAYILSNSFTIATFERFSMPSYVFITIWMAFGVLALLDGFSKLISYVRRQSYSSLTLSYAPVLIAICLIIPLNLFFINYGKMAVLKNDRTAENFAKNILDTADKNAILLISKDNEIFNTSYLNIAMGYRPDVAVINMSHLFDGKRYKNIQKYHPDLLFPAKADAEFDQEFIKLNAKKRPIYTNSSFAMRDNYVWVREGLLYKLYKKDNLPSEKSILQRNDDKWNAYIDPYEGSLRSYKHLMLASNLLLYRIYRTETADYFFAGKDFAGAERHYKAAIRYDDSNVKLFQRLAASQIEQKKCDVAEKNLQTAYERFPTNLDTPLFFVKLYSECIKSKDKIIEWKKVYDELQEASQQKLQRL